jgi:hypothetical protein
MSELKLRSPKGRSPEAHARVGDEDFEILLGARSASYAEIRFEI